MITESIKNCHCGFNPLEDILDTIYPTKRDRSEWIVYCNNISLSGCGRVVYGSSEDEVIDRWNKGETDEIDEGRYLC